LKKIFIAAFLVILFVSPLFAGSTATQIVKITVERIAEISVHGDPEIHLNTAVAKEATAEGYYDITINYDAQIFVNIDRNLPEGMSLFVSAQSPNNGSFSPEIFLSGEGKPVVEVSPAAVKNNRIKYRLVYDGIDEYKGEVGIVFTVVDD